MVGETAPDVIGVVLGLSEKGGDVMVVETVLDLVCLTSHGPG